MTAATLHVIAAGAWIGGLFHLWRASRLASEVTLIALIGAFHRVAMVSVALLALSGLGHVLMMVPELSGLGSSAWGRIYLAKMLLVAATLVLGYGHWRHAEAVVRGGAREKVRASFGREMLLAVTVLAVTGFLTTAAPPE
jgi:putative copper export protein